MDISQAVEQERLHYESGVLNVEYRLAPKKIELLEKAFAKYRLWPEKNLFFGGAHSVMRDGRGELSGKGDSRRGGVYSII